VVNASNQAISLRIKQHMTNAETKDNERTNTTNTQKTRKYYLSFVSKMVIVTHE